MSEITFNWYFSGKDPVDFKETTDEGFTADNLIQFIRTTSGKYVGLPGCLEAFDKVAAKFSAASDEIKRYSQHEAHMQQ